MIPDSSHFLILSVAGTFVGFFGVAVGGGMFFSMPLIQGLFPGISVGTVVGNIKVAAFFRGIGSTVSTWRRIDYRQALRIAPLAMLGTVLGASSIVHLSQKWLLPAMVLAIAVTLLAPKIADRITPRMFYGAAFLTGLYNGILGAGLGVIMVALMRLRYPSDSDIGLVKIQARFIEFALMMGAVATHFLNGNLRMDIWIPLSIGSIVGGYLGGLWLHKMGEFKPRTQFAILCAAFAVDLVVAGIAFVKSP